MIRKTTLSESTAFKGIMLINNNIKNIKKILSFNIYFMYLLHIILSGVVYGIHG